MDTTVTPARTASRLSPGSAIVQSIHREPSGGAPSVDENFFSLVLAEEKCVQVAQERSETRTTSDEEKAAVIPLATPPAWQEDKTRIASNSSVGMCGGSGHQP